jgi:hypothetical protein
VQNWVLYVKAALLVTAVAAWTAAILCGSKAVIETLWTWLMSKVDAWVEIHYPMCAQNASDVTGSSSTTTGHQD